MGRNLSSEGVRLVRETDVPYSEIVAGMDASRGLTEAALTTLGGGWVRMDGAGELNGWTLRYDEVLYCVRGQLEVEEEGGARTAAEPGQAIMIGSGTTVTYRAKPDTLVFFVLNPRDWDRQDAESDTTVR